MRFRRRHVLVVLVVMSGALGGCVTNEADTAGDEMPATEPPFDERVVLSYDMTGICDVSELWLEADDPDRFLPSGFHSASAGAPFVVRTETCGAADTGAAASLFVRIEPPPLDDRVHANMSTAMAWAKQGFECDTPPSEYRYFIAGYSDAPFWVQRFRQAGIPSVKATVAQSLDLVEAVAGLAHGVAHGEAASDGAIRFSYDAIVRKGDPPEECVFTFFQSDHGLLVLEEVLRAAPTFAGPATCDAQADQPFAWVLDTTTCAQASAVFSAGAQRDGYAFWFHATFVTPPGGA